MTGFPPPPPPIPLAPHTAWMTPREVDTFQVHAPTPRVFVPPPPVFDSRMMGGVAPPPPPPPIPLPVALPPPPPIPLGRPVFVMDTECYSTYWSIGFMDVATEHLTEFEFYPGTRLDIAGVARMMTSGTIVSFNGKNYDDPMIALALTGADNMALKRASDAIIKQGVKPWIFEKEYGVKVPAEWDSVDLIEVLPGQYNLKMYGGKMGTRKIQDLPIDPDASITPELRPQLRTYRNNDLQVTREAWFLFKPQIDLRAEMRDQYNVELRSKSDAQIAEAVIKSELNFYVEKPFIPAGTIIKYKTPDFIAFHTDQMKAVLATVQAAEFYISDKFALTMPKEIKEMLMPIGQARYQFGIGGLHSTEASVTHYADADYSIKDHDVASYYPSIIIRCGLYPTQMGPAFLGVYKKIVTTRLHAKVAAKAAKKAGDKVAAKRHQVTADALKIVVNGSFGKFGSRYSILYAPDLMLQTTITGQLCLLMLIEQMEMAGIQVIQGNTDGVVIKCRRAMEWLKDDIIREWEQRTGFETEMTEYTSIHSQSVNAYVAFKPDGEVKRKGDFAPPVPVGGSWPSPTNMVCVDAVIAYLQNGTPVEQTIRACTDVRKFVTVQGVQGGGVKYFGAEVMPATTIKGKREQLLSAGWEEAFEPKTFTYGNSAVVPMDEAHKMAIDQLRAASPVRKEYLGKTVRWYYAKDEPGAIHYKTNGNLVPRSTGARPMMELTDAVPADIDWQWYIDEANAQLRNIGCPP